MGEFRLCDYRCVDKEVELEACRLCGQADHLQQSHLLPQAGYRVLRTTGSRNPNPVFITRNSSWVTSSQLADKLLCSNCEQRFHKHGEDWVLRRHYRGASPFAFRALLDSLRPVRMPQIEAKLVPTRGVTGVDMGQLAYFAVS